MAEPLTTRDFEKFLNIRVSNNVGVAKWIRGSAAVAVAANACVGFTGKAALLGSGFGMGAAFVVPIAAVANAFLSLGIPVAEAKQIVHDRNFHSGMVTGYTLVSLEYGKSVLHTFRRTSANPGLGSPSYMRGVARDAKNAGLIQGYAAASQQSAEQRKAWRDAATNLLIEDCRKNGTNFPDLNMMTVNAHIHLYSRAFSR